MLFRILLIMVALTVGIAEADEPAADPTPAAEDTVSWRLVDSREDLRRASVGSESRYVLAPGRRQFDLTGVDRGTLRISFGVADAAWLQGLEELEFGISVRSAGKIRASLLGRLTAAQAGRWRDLVLALPSTAGQQTVLRLEAQALRGVLARPAHLLWTPPLLSPKPAVARPNIVLVSIDTLRADHLGCYGYGRDTTPNIDRLAREGIVFKNAIASSPWTLPSHASMFTGLQPQHHGAVVFGFFRNRLAQDFDTVAELLWDRGYETAGFTDGGFVSAYHGLDQGFDRFREEIGTLAGSDDSFERSITAAQSWLGEGATQPFFLFLHTYAVHTPYTPPRPFDTLFDGDYVGPFAREFAIDAVIAVHAGKFGELSPRTVEHLKALYDGEIRAMDRLLQKLFDRLKSTGLANSTCVIFTSDHGEEFEEHGDLFHNRPKLYEELVRIPLIVWCPWLYEGGRVIDEPVSLVDVMPTVLSMAGIPPPPGIDGRSQEPVLAGRARPSRRVVLSHVHKSNDSAGPLVPRLPAGADAPLQCEDESLGSVVAARALQYKLIRDSDGSGGALYDLFADPRETTDVAAQYPKVVEQLLKAFDGISRDPSALQPVEAEATPDAATRERLRALGYVK